MNDRALTVSGSKPEQVIRAVSEGITLIAACEMLGLSMLDFRKALESEQTLAISYARAREIRSDVLVEEAIAFADSDANPSKVRNQIEIRKWVASKWSKTYSDRIDLNVTTNVSITSALESAKARLLPVRDSQDIEDAIFTSDARQLASALPDGVSVTHAESTTPGPIPNVDPDIFA